jgi:hypothetical protein
MVNKETYADSICIIVYININLLATDFFLILAHSVFKM